MGEIGEGKGRGERMKGKGRGEDSKGAREGERRRGKRRGEVLGRKSDQRRNISTSGPKSFLGNS